MLFVISDLHLTDGTTGSGSPVRPEDADEFVHDIDRFRASTGSTEPLEILLLGDVFDVLRSERWHQGGAMPWDYKAARDAQNTAVTNEIETRVGDIAQDICTNNAAAIQRLVSTGAQVHFVIGNHDRPINWSAAAQTAIRSAFGMGGSGPFPDSHTDGAYGVYASHGHTHDSLNWAGPEEPCFGDAMPILIVDGLPRRIRDSGRFPAWFLDKVHEVEDVRPMWALASWLKGLEDSLPDRQLRRALIGIWRDAVREYLAVPHIRDAGTWWRLGEDTDLIKAVLKAPWSWTERFCKIDYVRYRVELTEHTFAEAACSDLNRVAPDSGGDPRITTAIYGHTHSPRQTTLDITPSGRHLIYLNAGTWRRSITPAALEKRTREFLATRMVSYIVLYKESEQPNGHRFETWSGALHMPRPTP